MGVSRSGYYKWKKRAKSKRDIKREEMIALVETVHADHKTHGYHWTAAYIRLEYGYKCSDNYVKKRLIGKKILDISFQNKHEHKRNRLCGMERLGKLLGLVQQRKGLKKVRE